MIETVKISVPVAGSSGSAVGVAKTRQPLNGRLLAVHVDYVSQPNTADVSITAGTPSQSLLTVTNANTDGWFYPRRLMDGVDGAALTAIYDTLPIDDYVSVAVAQGNAGSVEVTLLIER